MCSVCGGLLTGLLVTIATLTSFTFVLLGQLLQALTGWIYTKLASYHQTTRKAR